MMTQAIQSFAGIPARDPGAFDPSALVATALPVIGHGAGHRPATAVVLREREAALGDNRFVLALADADGEELLALGSYDETDVVAEWRRLGATSGLPLVVVGPTGARATAHDQIGRLRFGGALPRRRSGVPAGRRPRFLARRKVGQLALRPQVHRGEPEIIGGAA